MRELFVAMLKEEWRIHSTMTGNLGFALFPIMIAGFTFMAAWILPVLPGIVPIDTLAFIVHALFALMGVMVGSFGIMGREFMNRRFGQASLIAYSSRSLPVSERRIFSVFIAKDVVFYLFLWVIPAVLGIAAAAPFIGLSPGLPPLLLLTFTLSFLEGLAIVFFLSTIYAHSPRIAGALIAGAALAIGGASLVGIGPAVLLPPYAFLLAPSALPLLASLVLIAVPGACSIVWATVDYPDATRRFPNALTGLVRRFRFFSNPWFVAKDALDLIRSEGGIAKLVFSFLMPLALIWVFLSVLFRFIPGISPLIVFAILLGVISSTTYNWLTEFESFSSYAFLPVDVRTVLMSKLQSYVVINIVSLAVLLAIAFGTGEAGLVVPAVLVFVSVSAYTLAVTVRLTGLYPSTMLYNARVFFTYIAAIAPVLLILIFSSIGHPWVAAAGVLLLPVAWILISRASLRWTVWEMPSY
ncbi:MAG: hypothetical protein JXA08_01350 [Methanomicrobiaceae archaeon]|nr:hypothetical protein [Methanomicrobiaceae archaeon]